MADDSTPDQPGPRRQVEVYMQGMADVTPDLPVGFEELEARALDALDENAYDYAAGAASAERTRRANGSPPSRTTGSCPECCAASRTATSR